MVMNCNLKLSSLEQGNFAISASYTANDIGGGAREVISDLNGSLGPRHFPYVMNERTSFAS